MGQQTVRIHMPTTLDIHKAVQTSSSIFMTTGSPLSDVSRRQAPSRQLSRGSQGEFRPLSEVDHFSGVHHQLKENCPTANTDNRISGVHHQLNRYDPISLLEGAEQLDHRMQETTFQSTDNTVTLAVLPAPLQYRKLQFQKNEALACHHSYESPIQLNQESLEDLVWWCGHLKRWNGRPVHPATPRMIVETDASNTGWGAYYPALNQRTGGSWNQEELKLHINSKELLAAWIALQTQYPQGCTCSHQDGQHFSNSLYKSHGRYTLLRAVPDGDKDVELVLRSRTDSLGRTSTRMPECYSRLRVQEQEGPLRVGVKSNSIPEDYGSQGRMPGRSICLPTVSQTSNILQLEARPRCISSRCPCSRLEQYKRLCLPPFCLIGRCLCKIKRERVPQIILITSNHGSPTGSTGESPPINGSGTSPVGRLECIRSTFQSRGLSEDVVAILCAS